MAPTDPSNPVIITSLHLPQESKVSKKRKKKRIRSALKKFVEEASGEADYECYICFDPADLFIACCSIWVHKKCAVDITRDGDKWLKAKCDVCSKTNVEIMGKMIHFADFPNFRSFSNFPTQAC